MLLEYNGLSLITLQRTSMKVISEKTLIDRMSDYFRELEATGEELLVTKDGQFVLKIISYHRYSDYRESYPRDHANNQ